MFTDLRRAGHRLLLPMTVVAEVGYLLEQRVGPSVEAAFLDAVGDGDFEAVVAEPADFTRMAELVRGYGNLPLGTTDASVIAMAERLGLHRIATIDRRHSASCDRDMSGRSSCCPNYDEAWDLDS